MDRIRDLYAVKTNIVELLNSSRSIYEVSRFQRPYAWGQLQQDDLLVDLVNAMEYNTSTDEYETGDFFIGSFIFLNQKQDKKMQIVDGQQRLITLTMILSIIHKKFILYSQNNRVSKEAQSKAKDLIDEVRGLVYIKDDGKEFPIISPFKTKEKDYFYAQILNCENMKIDKPEDLECMNYFNAYNNINECIEGFFKTNYNSLRIVEFYRGLYKQIICSYGVKLELTDENRAYKIYSNINSKGLYLTQIDLIKNDFYYKTKNLNTLPGIDKQTKLWDELITKIKTNTRVPFELFYEYAWYYCNPEHIEEYFGNDSNLYEMFQDIFPNMSDGKKIVTFMNKLTKIADYFIKLDNPNPKYWNTDDWKIYLEKLDFMKKISNSKTTDQYSLILLPLYYQYETTKERKFKKALKKAITLLSDTLLIYNLLSKYDEQEILIEFESFFIDASQEFMKFSFDAKYNDFEKILISLEETRSLIISSAETLLIKIISELSYSKYISDNFEVVRYLLKRINEVDGRPTHAIIGSIEHIIEDENRDEKSSSIGNLVYLELRYNEEASSFKLKEEPTGKKLLARKFNHIYPKSEYYEVGKLVKGYNLMDISEKMIEERSIEISENYLRNFIKLK